MTDILDFPLFQFIVRFLSDFFAPVAGYLFTDTLTPYVGIRFVYLLMSMWLMWTVVNIFIIHPAPIGGLAADLADHEQRKEKSMLNALAQKKRDEEKAMLKAQRDEEKAAPKRYTRIQHKRNGASRTTRYVRSADGSVESWEV